MSNLNSSSLDEVNSVSDKKESATQNNADQNEAHICSGVSNCPDCRKKYDHSRIFSKRDNLSTRLKNFFHSASKKSNVDGLVPEIVHKNSNNSKELTVLPDNYRVRLSSSILSFSSKWYNSPLSKRILILCIVSLFSGFFSAIFIQNTGLYMSGLSGISQGVARLAHAFLKDPQYNWVYNLLFWGLTIVVNIPLFIFGYFKIGKDFTLLTLVYTIASNVVGFILSNIPGFSNFILIGPGPNEIPDGPNKIPDAGPVTWNYESSGRMFGMFFSGIVYSQLTAVVYMVIFTVNGSTGGFDFLSVWLSKKKHKSIAKIFTTISCTSMFVGTIFGGYIANCVSNDKWGEVNNYMFTPSLLFSLLMVLCQGITLNVLFPRSKWAKIEIYSDKIMDIRNILISDDHPHAVSILNITGGYSLQEKKAIATTALYFEIPRLLSLVRFVDKNCLVCISDIKSLDGYVYIYDNSERGKWRGIHFRKKTTSKPVEENK